MIAAGGGVMSPAIMRIALKRADDNRAGQIGAQDGEQKKPTFGLDARKLCQIGAQMSFRQQVGEEWGHTERDRAQGGDQPPGTALERKAERRALRVVDVVLFKRKDLAFSGQTIDDTDLPAVQTHGKRVKLFRIKLHLSATLGFSARRRPRRRGPVPHSRSADPGGNDRG